MPTRIFPTGAPGLAVLVASMALLSGQQPAHGVLSQPSAPTKRASGMSPRERPGATQTFGEFHQQARTKHAFRTATGIRRSTGRGRQQARIDGASLKGGDDRSPLARPASVQTSFEMSLDVSKGSRAWLVVDPPDGRIPPLTPEAQRRIATYRLALDLVNARPGRQQLWRWSLRRSGGSDLFDRCITRGVPGSMLPFLHGNSSQIVQAPGFVAIRYEIMHEARLISLDGRPHVGRGLHLDMGDPPATRKARASLSNRRTSTTVRLQKRKRGDAASR